jgi:hypothetical protein
LWADALCINQDDLDERTRQVELMRRIYSDAELVLSWLGQQDDETKLALLSIADMADEMRLQPDESLIEHTLHWVYYTSAAVCAGRREKMDGWGVVSEIALALGLELSSTSAFLHSLQTALLAPQRMPPPWRHTSSLRVPGSY